MFALPDTKLRLGDMLVHEKRLTEAQLQQALARQKQSGRRLGEVLQELGFITDDVIAELLARQLLLPYFDGQLEQVDLKAAHRLSESQVRKLRALPVGFIGDRIRVVVVDPSDWQTIDDLPPLLHCTVEIEIIAESTLNHLIDRLYSSSANDRNKASSRQPLELMRGDANDTIAGLARQLGDELRGSDAEGVVFSTLGVQAGAEDAPVVKLLQGLFDEAVRLRASDVHVEPMAQNVAIRLRVDGHLRPHTEFDLRLASALTSRLKLVAELDISERRLPQDGRFVVQVRQKTVDIRLSTMPGQFGESVVMRLLMKDPMLSSLDRLGLPAAGLLALGEALDSGAGLVLVTGPTGSGKTTTLYAALGALDAGSTKILTAEDPVEYRLPGITQVNINDRIGLGFSQVLRAALRQDPDALLIGEMRDQETVDTCMRAAITGHLVLSTLHTNDATSAAARLIDMGAAPYMVGMALQTVIAQRLVRRVCVHCAEASEPTPAQRAWLNAQLGRDEWDATGLKHGRGCSRCRSTGFDGRHGIYEVLAMNGEMVGALLRNDLASFSGSARAAIGTASLAHEAARAVVRGQTTATEAMRIGVRNIG